MTVVRINTNTFVREGVCTRKPRRTIAHLAKTVLVLQVRTTTNNPLLPFGRDLKLGTTTLLSSSQIEFREQYK